MVCPEDWEMRHPQDFLRVQKEKITVEFSRPYPAQDDYIPYCTIEGSSGMPGWAEPGCAIPGRIYSITWDTIPFFKASKIPAAITVIILSVFINMFLDRVGGYWSLDPSHLVQVPVASSLKDSVNFLLFPDFSVLGSFDVYIAAITIALVASL